MVLTKPALYTPVALETLAEADHQEGLHETDRTTIRDLCDEIGVPAANGTHLPYVRLGDGSTSGLWVPAHVLAADNPIINGGFHDWPTGTSFAAIAHGSYAANLWRYINGSAAVHTVQRAADVPAVAAAMPYDSYSLHVDCTTADASVAAGDYIGIQHFIEGFMFAPYAQRTFTLGFWVKATKTGIYSVSFRNSGSDRTYVGEYTVNVADTWEFKSIQVSASPTAGTWDYTTGIGIQITFSLMCGSTFAVAAGSWATGNYLGSTSQVNAGDSTSNDWKLYGVRITPGNAPAMFVPRHPAIEDALARRYFMRLGGVTNAPLTNGGYATSSTQALIPLVVPPMRSTISPTFAAASNFTISSSAGSPALTSISSSSASPYSFVIVAGVASGLTDGQACYMYGNSTSGTVDLSARLV